jgi:hypothetical protein
MRSKIVYQAIAYELCRKCGGFSDYIGKRRQLIKQMPFFSSVPLFDCSSFLLLFLLLLRFIASRLVLRRFVSSCLVYFVSFISFRLVSFISFRLVSFISFRLVSFILFRLVSFISFRLVLFSVLSCLVLAKLVSSLSFFFARFLPFCLSDYLAFAYRSPCSVHLYLWGWLCLSHCISPV